MKVFKLKKNNEHQIGHDIFNMKIEEKKKINCIVINNPAQSNCLCIINHLVCKFTGNKNIAHLVIANEDKALKDTTAFGNLNVGYKYDMVQTNGNLEIDIVNIDKNQEVDMLNDDFLIILPGGNLHIELEEPQGTMSLQISVDQQII